MPAAVIAPRVHHVSQPVAELAVNAMSTVRLLRSVLRAALKSANHLYHHVCLEVFAGTGKLTARWRRSGFGAVATELTSL
jgi:hypothetical protein